jgi:predicted AlkP superfamily pyrophosphatase or phosphodiesterase
MKRIVSLTAGIFLLAGWSASPLTSSGAPQKKAIVTVTGAHSSVRHVIVVSVDGLMPDSYTSPDLHGLKVPTLREMVEHGAASPGVRGVMPTVTYPAHTTIATGVSPRTHGIIANAVFDPEGKNDGGWYWYTEDIRVPTLWDVARVRGLRTALVGWPVTLGARADFNVPEFWRMGTDGPKLLRAISTPGLFAAVEKRFSGSGEGFATTPVKDQSLTDIAVHLIETARPNLLMLHIAELDHWQHEKGPWSAEALAKIENADRQIARLIEAAKSASIWDETVLVVLSDHGFASQARVVRPAVLLRQKDLITLDEKTQKKVTGWKAQILSSGGSAYIYIKDDNDAETKRIVQEIFQPLAGKPGSGIARVLTAEEIAAMGGDSAAFLALEPAEGFGFVRDVTGEYETDAPRPGLHGFPPDRDAMRSSLLFYGPRIVPGRIEDARLIDIGPTVARMLGLRLEKAEGTPLGVPLKTSPR